MDSVPHGAMVEVTADLIDEGKFMQELNLAIRQAHDALKARHARGERSGECVIQATVKIGYDKDIDAHLALKTSVVTKTPKNERVCLVKEQNGLMLCAPSGADSDTPDQQRLFDARGRAIGVLDKRTGEVVEEKAKAVAGKIG